MNNVRETLMQFPEVTKLIGVPQPEQWHPEGDSFEHTVLVVEQAEKRYPKASYLWHAAVTHDLGKAYTDPAKWPKHYGHADLGIKPTREFLEHIGTPEDVILVCELTTKYHMHIHQALDMKNRTYAKIMWEILQTANKVFTVHPRREPMLTFVNTIIDTLARVGVCDHYGRGSVSQSDPCIEACVFHAILTHMSRFTWSYWELPKDRFVHQVSQSTDAKFFQSLKLSHPMVNKSMEFLEMEFDDIDMSTGVV